MTTRKMLLGMQFGNGYGSQTTAWRAPRVDPFAYTDFDAMVRYAQVAERGKLQFLFLPDTPALSSDLTHEAPQMTLEPLITLAAVARETSHIGLVSTASTTFMEPYNLARQFKTLDVLSHGRMGWNPATTSDPNAAANFGAQVADRPERYKRAHETIQIVQALWGSWQENAWIGDKAAGRFADMSKIVPVNLGGTHVASRGPLPIPPSEQGQPVVFQAGGGANGLGIAGRYANGVIGSTFTIDDARAQRQAARDAAEQVGRDPDEIKFFAGVMPAIAPTVREAIDGRLQLGADTFLRRVPYLGQMLGIELRPAQLDCPLTPTQLEAARPTPFDPRAPRALKVAAQGWTVREILAHGVIDYHPTPIGPGSVTADHMQEWFEAGAVDGFWVSIDVYENGVDTFVDEVVPILQQRGLFHEEYECTTLPDHLGVARQYGPDPRIS
ncbi:LLM class flavin-dependent oxidoreductase [Brevibacterium permense]|uniref:NtaA/DmoA family FMN-dependent monooxygenase n=1 Tax=Brevibacterium permense TaxID=234834 RepID=UPI0021CF2DC0|nr:NtaA/DmoA family FMN-dependent monooxygenase [Brevibacterium permense]MCU4297170.1 LLM class flavin-dependent oxidoreductase [Brevibacterium permense]